MAKLTISQEEKNRRGEIMRAGRRAKLAAVAAPEDNDDTPLEETREDGKKGEIKGN